MVPHLVRFVAGLGLIAASTISVATPADASYAVSQAAATSPQAATLTVNGSFSPNGDGVKDTALVEFTLDQSAARISLTFRTGYTGNYDKVRRVVLKNLESGAHTWTWNGRDGKGRRVKDGRYKVTLKGDGVTATDQTQVDTQISARIIPRETWAGTEETVQKVFPRTTVLTDSVALRPVITESVRWATLLIQDAKGRTVFDRDVSDSEDTGGYRSPDYGVENPDDVLWTARRHGTALPPGRYRARIRARDRAGNTGHTEALRLYVSRDVLEWREEPRVVTAAETSTYTCGVLDSGSGCGEGDVDRCGTVIPSTLLVGGLSHRAGECAQPTPTPRLAAVSFHYLRIPEAVRGIASAKVGFTGRPTVDGESDAGTLSLRSEDYSTPGVSASSNSAGETPWVDCPLMCQGRPNYYDDGTNPPGVAWYFSTSGTDAFDVGTFTVTARFLVVAD